MHANTLLGTDISSIRFFPDGFSSCEVDNLPVIDDRPRASANWQIGVLVGSIEDIAARDVIVRVGIVPLCSFKSALDSFQCL